jgi:ABC-type glycerol-3-phosphate transport system substrate-binding protein
MKKIILILAIFASIGLAAQGTLVQDNMILRTIPQYDISNGTSEWVIDLRNPQSSAKWGTQFTFTGTGGAVDITLTVWQSMDLGVNYAPYPKMASAVMSTDTTITFDDSYTVYDNVKIIMTVDTAGGGAVDVNQRLITNPNK